MNFNYNLKEIHKLNLDLITHCLPYTTQKIKLMVFPIISYQIIGKTLLYLLYFQNLFFIRLRICWSYNQVFELQVDLNDKLYYSPRLSLKYKIMSKIFYEFSYGKQYQFTEHVSNDNLNDNKKFHWQIISDNIPEINSSNFFNGISYNWENFV